MFDNTTYKSHVYVTIMTRLEIKIDIILAAAVLSVCFVYLYFHNVLPSGGDERYTLSGSTGLPTNTVTALYVYMYAATQLTLQFFPAR